MMEPFIKKYERKRLSTLYIAPAFMYAGTVLSTLIFLGFAMLFTPAATAKMEGILWLNAAAQFAIGMPLCAVCMLQIPADPMERFRLRVSDLAKAFMISCFFMVLGSLIGTALGTIPGLPSSTGIDKVLAESGLPYQIVSIVILAPLWEEFVFRKLMVDRINRLGDRAAMVISAFVFAAYHANLQQFFYAFGAGLVFAYVYLRTGKLRYSIVLHMLVNLMYGVLPGRFLLSGDGNLIVSAVIAAVEYICALAGFILLILERKRIKLLKGWIRLPKAFPVYAVLNPGMIIMIACCAGMMFLNRG